MEQAEAGILIVAVVILILLGSFLVFLFLIFVKRKNKLIETQQKAEEHFKHEIVTTQIEIREETLRNISWELHDNIGQLMTLAKIQAQNAQGDPKKMEAVSEIIGKGLNELRALSKSINPNTIRDLDLQEAIHGEIERFNRLNFIDAKLTISGERIDIDSKTSVILFRILQEFFSNTIKHAQATELVVEIVYSKLAISVIVRDNGIGIHKNEEQGQGLKNMNSRAKLIGADLDIQSVKEKGTTLEMRYAI
ncbi:sensor histidine kinase [Maribacter sp. 2308TA10-17]|uniref:sensor histidine kinase n=1 Tax=Maribacter sp. 2308TA10-17 TaxID=3386276 RepID=UPI0039BCF538